MNRKYILIPLVASAAAFTSCKDKTTTTAPSAEKEKSVTETLTAKVEDLIKPSASAEERAAKLGFAAYLPKNVTTFSGIYNGRAAFDKLLQSKLGVFVMERMAEEGVSLDDLGPAGSEISDQIAMYSEEYITAYGPGAGDDIEQAVALYEGMLYYGGSFGMYFADMLARDGKDFNERSLQEAFMPISNGPLKGAPAELIKIMSKFDIPAVYQAAKISDADERAKVLAKNQQALELFTFEPEISELVTFKKGESEFTGYKVSGQKIVDKMNAEFSDRDKAEIEKIFKVEDIENFKKTLATKNFVMAMGTLDEYVVTFIGSSVEDFVLADKAEDSILSRKEIAPIDQYLDKDLIVVSFADDEFTKNISSLEVLGYRLVTALADGLKKGVSESNSLGDMQDMEAILGSLSDQGKALAAFFKPADQCSVAYIEDGVKVESYGGSNMPAIDFKPKHSLAPLGESGDVVFFANWTSNEEYNSLVSEYVDTIFETGYMAAERVAGLDIDDRDFKDFQQGFQMFDQMGKKEIIELSEALRGDFSDGLGAEAAVVVDLKGKLPKVPGVPAAVLEEAKMPRIAFASTVNDRSKLQSAWTRTNQSVENMLKMASSMSGQTIPMQVPMSSEKDGLKTWFVPIPFQNDDFVPSISVSDKLFFASTSKSYSEGLADLYEKGGADAKHGAWMHVNFTALHKYAEDLLVLTEKHAEEFMPAHAHEDFMENKPMIQEALEAFGGIKSLTSHIRQEDGQTRISAHFKAE